MEGIVGIIPRIKKVTVDSKNITINLEDGRVISSPLKYFPSIKKLKPEKRKLRIFGDGQGLDLVNGQEMYHIRDFLGIPEEYLKNRYKEDAAVLD
jgi:hypothetical protein